MSRTPAPPRIVSAFFPELAMDRWRRITAQQRTLPDEAVPVVLSHDGSHGPVVHAVSDAARALGIREGARVVDVQAIHPDLHVERADPEGDRALLKRLALWARRWCPWTVAEADGIVLDVSGAAHLFGGEAQMLRDINARFVMQGLRVRLGLAPTRGAAQMLARYGAQGAICGADDLGAALAPLPVTALRLPADTVRLLDRLGLKTIGALEAVPRTGLMRRFAGTAEAVNPLVLLDRAMGRSADPLDAPADAQIWIARARMAEPVLDPVPWLDGLAEDLCAQLAAAERGARRLRLTVYRVDGEWRARAVATASPSRDAAHLVRLVTGKVEGIDPGFGFDLMTLEALRVEPLSLHQGRLDGTRDGRADVAALLDRLTAKLGPEKISWPTWVQSHKPERVEGRVPALAGQIEPPPQVLRERPLRLFDPPEEVAVLYAVPEGPPARFRWRRVAFVMARFEGPERIAPEWWRDRPGTRLRDYYRVEVTDGRRFWIFREGILGDRRGGAPRWFVQGVFG
ncbi:DNA polymerase Y family protein [uncultured Sulfitobacter sp.]|uniref:Y-family DNA polymerase n=1 Tax=uncultured Sulfitobacter sp. TaxID=191468 RepID=UPI0026345CE0|nr:DNA polymerase Y family protein [uncultured Sulfitobacter sp.]